MATFIPNVTLVFIPKLHKGAPAQKLKLYVCVCPLNHTQPGQITKWVNHLSLLFTLLLSRSIKTRTSVKWEMWETKKTVKGRRVFNNMKVSSRPHEDTGASSELIFTSTSSGLHSSAALSQKQPHWTMKMPNVNPKLTFQPAAFEAITTVFQLHR